uniref:Serpentine receptor class gamma n=1 Tax=Panagrolaimus davidi TaxID=227884 RepID=A0A914QRS0_9BILA
MEIMTAMQNVQYYIADFSTLAPAWFILATNKILRHQIAFYFCAMKPEDIARTATVQIKNRFSAPFYQLFGFSAINYIIHSAAYYIVIRMPNTPFFLPFTSLWPSHGPIPTFLYMILYYSAAAIHLYSVCLSFNRFTVFILKIGYQKFWKKYINYFLLFCLLAPFLTIWQFMFTDVWMKPDRWADFDGLRYFTQGNLAAIPWMDQARNLGLILAITSVLSFLSNLYVVFRLFRQRFCSKNFGQAGKVSPQDTKMCIYTILIFATEVVSCIQQFAFSIVTDDAVLDAMFNIQYYIADFSTLAPAWFILATNKTLRHQIAFYFCAMKPIARSSTVQSIQPSYSNTARNTNHK